jgi:archaellin
MDMLVLKAAGQLVVIGCRLFTRSDIFMFAMLSAVSRDWWGILRSRKYTKKLFKRYFGRVIQPYRRVSSIQIGSVVQGIAEFKGNIFVKENTKYAIQVYSDISGIFELVYEIQTNNLWIVHLFICSVTEYLYIVDLNSSIHISLGIEGQHIRRIKLDQRSTNEVESFITTRCRVGRTSVRCGRVLVTPTFGQPQAIFHYDEDGRLNRRIRLPQDMHAIDSVETANESFVVSYNVVTHVSTSQFRSSVRELTNRGLVLREYDGVIKLQHPIYIALDVSNHLLVVDRDNAAVIILNSDLELEKALLTIPQIDSFIGGLFSNQTGKLYIHYRSHLDVYALASF